MQRRNLGGFSLAALVAGELVACSTTDSSVLKLNEETAVEFTEPVLPDPMADVEESGYGPGVPFGPPESIFERNHVVEVRVELAPEDWEKLSFEGMSFGEVAFPSLPNRVRVVPEYTEFAAQVTVDGVVHDNVAVRKKGYIGSLSSVRPSMKFHFSRNFEEGLAAGMKRMTLNNDRQDPSHTRQCMAYDLFEKLGMPSPRCNFAHVVVNGVDLGFYTHLESIKKPMLSRFFDDNDGNMYEGEISDFNEESHEHLELKTNEEENDRSDIQPVIDALALEDDDAMIEALGAVVDLDNFFDFWALETLLGHWDGYAGASNNYRAYHDPTTDKFFFIPWGTDQTFTGNNPNSPLPYLDTVYATGALANRLYAAPAQRERFRARLGELNEELWDVPTLLAEVDAIAELAADADPANLEVQRSYIRHRGETLRASLLEPAPEWVNPPPPAPPIDDCVGTSLELTGTFSTVWRQQIGVNPGEVQSQEPDSQASFQLGGQPLGGQGHFLAGETTAAGDSRVHRRSVLISEAMDDDGRLWFFQSGFRLEHMSPGFHPFHGIDERGFLGMVDTLSGSFQQIAIMGEGGLQLDEVILREGEPVAGSFTATAYLFQCVETAIAATEQARADIAAQFAAQAEAQANENSEGETVAEGEVDDSSELDGESETDEGEPVATE